MLIKAADDKQADVAVLEQLLGRDDVFGSARRRIQEEIWSIRAGAKTESDAAYEIEFQFGKSKNAMTIHDLRIEVDGRVAQIDHLIITRILEIWVCESKSFTDGVAINDHGEWSAYRGRQLHGIASPIEQNKRHMQVLNDVFANRRVSLPTRLGITLKPRLESLVLVSNAGLISRPKGSKAQSIAGLDRVIKVEQLVQTIDKTIDKKDAGGVAVALMTMVSSDTLEKFARALADLHTPIAFDWHAKFGIPLVPSLPSTTQFAQSTGGVSRNAEPSPKSTADAGVAIAAAACESCGGPVSEKVLAYCRDNGAKFGGKVLCFQCQRRRRPA